MINTAQALYQFWSSFGLPAATIGTVPDGWNLPYITYSLVETEPTEPATCYAQVWYRDTANAAMLAKVDEIKNAIKTAAVLKCNGGYVVLRPLSPFVQLMVDENPENRYAYISLQINCYHE